MIQGRHSVLFLGDILALCLSFALMVLLRFDLGTQLELVILQAKLFAGIFVVWLIVFFIFDLYTRSRLNPNPQNIGMLLLAMLINTGVAILFFYVSPHAGITPKTNLVILSLSALLFLIVWRRLFYLLFTKTFSRTIGLLGESALMHKLHTELEKHEHLGKPLFLSEKNISSSSKIDLVVAEKIHSDHLLEISLSLGAQPVSLSHAYQLLFAKMPLELMSEEKALTILGTKKRSGGVEILYRLFECLVAILVLIFMLPFLLIAILAISLEDGKPWFIAQKRNGKHQSVFTMYKLRTMKALAPDGSAETKGVQWAGKKDPRITRVGKVLRKLHLDEVPQMWNVLRGELAFIGPRPERPEIVAGLEKEIPYYFLRHTIKPGFTGWAQIKFPYARTVDDSREKFEYDLYYLLHRDPLLDVGILVKTIQIIFTH